MKKLLLCAMLAAACISDVNASAFQTKASKSNVDVILKEDMGNYYKGMLNLVNAQLVGWADSLSYAAKDPDFKAEKTQLSNASKKLKVIAKFTESMLNRDREKGITSNQSKAIAAAQAFHTVVNQLKNTEYWKHCGAQLRFSIIVVTNSLQSLAQKNSQFYMAGARVSSSQGLVDGNGYSVYYDLADENVMLKDNTTSGTSKVSNVLSVFKAISSDLAIASGNTNVKASSVGNLSTSSSSSTLYGSTVDSSQIQSAAVSTTSLTPAVAPVQPSTPVQTATTAPVQSTVPTPAPVVVPVQTTVPTPAPAVAPVQNTVPVQPAANTLVRSQSAPAISTSVKRARR